MNPAQRPPGAASSAGAAPPYRTLTLTTAAGVASLALARPEVHNAFDEVLVAELTAALTALDADPAVRVVVLRGQGASFCAGGDLNWMRRMAHYGDAENLADANALAGMLKTLARLTKPTLARVHGAAYGGGVGLVACCDIALAAPDAVFALSEARLGLIPATIGPYVIEAIGARAAHRYFLTAERFGAIEALRLGLVHDVVPAAELDGRVDALVRALLQAGPGAQAASKALIHAVAGRPIDDAVIADTAARIAAVRASDEGREGVAAFLDKRPPGWAPRER
jgi:methylglutaconyl-CoA hydratase